MTCFLAPYSSRPCSGRLVRVHLIPRQLLRRELDAGTAQEAVLHPGSWVLACGGPMGNGGHHGELDQARTVRIPRDDIPAATEDLAERLGLVWWLDRTYGR